MSQSIKIYVLQETPSADHSVPLGQAAGMELPRGRHFPLHRAGPGSDSGSSGNSSADSIDSSSSSNRPIGAGVGGHASGLNAGPGLGAEGGDPQGAGGAPAAVAGQQLPHLGFPPVPASPAGVSAASHLSAVVTSTPAAAMQGQV